MAEMLLNDTDAAALSGVTDTLTGVPYPPANADPWLVDFYQYAHQQKHATLLANTLRVYPVDGNDDAVGVRAGRCRLGGVALSWAGAEPAVDALADNDTTYLWLYNNGGAAAIGSAIDATGWPGTAHVKLAEVTMAGGAVGTILDRRAEQVFTTDGPALLRPGIEALRHADGAVVDTTGATGRFTLVVGGWGDGGRVLRTQAVQNASDQATVSWELSLPPGYVAGSNPTLRVHARHIITGGTTTTATADVQVYRIADDGTAGADLSQTAATDLTASVTAHDFTVDGTGLVAGDRLGVLVRCAVSEGGDSGTVQGELAAVAALVQQEG